MKRRSFVAASLALAVPSSSLAAKAQPTETAIDFAALFPAASEFGSGWKRFNINTPTEVDNDIFIDGAFTAFGGPHGQRVRVQILEHSDDRAAVNAAWESVTYSIVSLFLTSDYDVDYFNDSLDAAPIPSGTADAMRYQGTLQPYEFKFDAGAYAIEPNIVVIVSVEGDEVEFAGDGFTIADNIASAVATRFLAP